MAATYERFVDVSITPERERPRSPVEDESADSRLEFTLQRARRLPGKDSRAKTPGQRLPGKDSRVGARAARSLAHPLPIEIASILVIFR